MSEEEHLRMLRQFADDLQHCRGAPVVATIGRLTAGKKVHRGKKRAEGRWPYGEHPRHEHDGEREVGRRILKMRAKGVSGACGSTAPSRVHTLAPGRGD